MRPSSLTTGSGGAVTDSARRRGGPSSLAYTDQTEPSPVPLRCPQATDRVVIELISGDVYQDRCRRLLCAYCLPLNARRRCLAITYAAPTRMIRLSLAAGESDESPCTTARGRVGLIARNLKRMGRPPGEWTWTIEQNPKDTGYHIHMLQRGPSIPQEELQEACARSGAGIPWIKSIARQGIWTSRYGLKGFGAEGYGLKGFRANADPVEALRINNKRTEHHSTGFFAIDGTAIPVREFERLAIIAKNGIGRVAFVGTTQSQVDRILNSRPIRTSLIRDAQHRSLAKLRIMA